MNKKGEMTTQQIVILIVVIISFIVLLFFLFRLNLGSTSEKEICHNSVVTKGNPILSKGDVSLNCQRTYVCLTQDGSCESLTNPDIRKVESKEEVYQELAQEMSDCWWIYGEGKIDYVGDKLAQFNYCSVCSQVAFDDSVKTLENEEGVMIFEDGKIDLDNFYEDYLAVTPVSENSETYAEYFFGTRSIQDIKNSVYNDEINSKGIDSFGHLDMDEQEFVMTGITSEIGNSYKLAGAGVAILALLTPIGWVGGAIVISAGVTAGIAGDDVAEKFEPKIGAIMVPGEGVENAFMAPTIIEAKQETFKALNCKDIVSLS